MTTELAQHWYKQLISDLKQLAFEGIVRTKHTIGKRIIQDEMKFGKPKYGSKRIENLARDLEVSRSDLYYCVQFAKAFPEFSAAVGKFGKNVSWRYIRHCGLPIPRLSGEVESRTPALPAGKFNLIYADPPWRYDFAETTNRQIENKYPTMSNEALCDLQPPNAKSSCLYLWATNPKLREALRVMDAWGFTYLTNMVWVKDRIGLGYWARQRHELLLIGKCGDISPPIPKDRPDSVIAAPRKEHSAKPQIIYELLEKLHPNARRLEMFARSQRRGWTAWGNEA